MQRRIAALVLSVLALTVCASPAAARSTPTRSAGRPLTIQTIFRLHVTGPVDSGTTFWVAYGPLAGHFGLLRLQEQTPGLYEASRLLPTDGRTLFSYVAGHGIIHTRAGQAPGNPVVTIRTVGPTSVWLNGIPAAHWMAPAG